MKKRVCVITGSRAEYGILNPLLKEMKKTSNFLLQIVATGSHLSREFGLTYKEIEKDGFVIDDKIKILSSSDTTIGISKSLGLAVIGLSKAFERLQPDLVVILGDRYEIFAAATAACVAGIPIGHIHGGERTEGAIDEAFRHAITKMSHLHFTAAEEYRKRVIQLGEHPSRVFNVGALSLDTIAQINFMSKESLQKDLGDIFGTRTFLITYHPVTLDKNDTVKDFKQLLDALNEFRDIKCIFTYANADAHGRIINMMIRKYVENKTDSAHVFPSLGQQRYLSIMKLSDIVIGNSSSGIIEAPSLKKATINIGDRQKGRLKAGSVIDCRPTKTGIHSAIKKGLGPLFQLSLEKIQNPYGSGDVSKKIVSHIIKRLSHIELKKQFFDFPESFLSTFNEN
jgi:GDP/UDP-N,N'-diacetylbacillosamine 2-epimerase (hydrolysing)